MLQLEKLSRVYERVDMTPFIAVDNVDLNIMSGDFVSIIGKSGSGKSTILHMITGLLRPTSGKILINGTDLWSLNEKEMAKIRSSKIGYIPQGLSLLSNLTIIDNVRIPFYLDNKKDSGIKQAMDLLEEMGIQNLSARFPSQLSGGEMRRAAIARALINKPEILIADEPTGDLDGETTKEVMKMFTRIHNMGVTIIMATHEYDINRYCKRIYTMFSGKLIEKNTACD